MKIVLSTLNSKFIHSSLSVRYLQSFVKDIEIVNIKEYTINQNIDFIVSDLYKMEAELIGFSTYIWNITEILKISETLKLVNPNLKILLGGPEVSYDGKDVLEKNKFIDFIIYGEGEETFKELVIALKKGDKEFKHIKGLIYRYGENIIQNLPRPPMRDLNAIPSPYDNIGNEFANKIVYYESSRGCPFNCKFCLSSTIKGLRFFEIERVKNELNKLIEGKVRQVKFVDRTFNANKEFAKEIMNFIIKKNPKDINFHFEVTAHLIDEDTLQFLSTVKEGLFQFEIGVQSTNLHTIEAVGRTTDFQKLSQVTKRIKSFKNIHQHLDLIAGLPFEGYNTFKTSFNDVYEIRPEKIQLGFLKLLKGTALREEGQKYNFKYIDIPPYEVLENNYITYGEIIKLKTIEDLVEKYYNEGYFESSLEYLISKHYKNPFHFYEMFSEFWEEEGYHSISVSRTKLYEILLEFYKYSNFEDIEVFIEFVKYDFLKNNRNGKLPSAIADSGQKISQSDKHRILKEDSIINNYLSSYQDLTTKRIIQNVAIDSFKLDILKAMENNFNMDDKSGSVSENRIILFVYEDGVINRCNTYDITKIVRELI
ncbi:MAG: B12-binding domain-containing radical SAM protein [Tissierellaceae bacterium]|nr:B12-binding domain-containing radical SAM protein [Tissierellaceae bacterium]